MAVDVVQKDLFERHCKWISSQHSTSIVLSHFCNVLLLLHTVFLFFLFDSRRWTRITVILVLLVGVHKDILIVMLINFLSDVHLLIYHKQKNLLHIITLYVGCSKRKWKIINNTQSTLYSFTLCHHDYYNQKFLTKRRYSLFTYDLWKR